MRNDLSGLFKTASNLIYLSVWSLTSFFDNKSFNILNQYSTKSFFINYHVDFQFFKSKIPREKLGRRGVRPPDIFLLGSII